MLDSIVSIGCAFSAIACFPAPTLPDTANARRPATDASCACIVMTSHPCLQATLALEQRPQRPEVSNMSREQYLGAVEEVKEHIQAGDVFQLVLSQRFQRQTFAHPFEIYR